MCLHVIIKMVVAQPQTHTHTHTHTHTRVSSPGYAPYMAIEWWVHADCLWRRLLHPTVLFACDDAHAAVAVAATLACTCHELRMAHAQLWLWMRRSYLRRSPAIIASRTLVGELVHRRMLARIHARLAYIGVHDVCIAGGFVAWQLERHLDTRMGRDGFPRSVRMPNVWWRTQCVERLWIPRTVNFFVHCQDRALASAIVEGAYRDLCVALFGHQSYRRVMCVNSQRHPRDPPPTVNDVVRAARDFEFPEDIVRQCAACVRDRAGCASDVDLLLATLTFFVENVYSPIVTTVRVHFTKPPPDERRTYTQWILQQMDLAHCAVAATVDVKDGTYRFTCTEASLDALARRRIVLTPTAFADERTYVARTFRQVWRYVGVGFTALGDEVENDHQSFVVDPHITLL